MSDQQIPCTSHSIEAYSSHCLSGAGNGFDAASLLTPARDSPIDVPPWDRTPDVAGTVAAIRSAGDLFAGSGLLNQRHTHFVRLCHS